MASVFHVATTGSDSSDGSREQPLRTINRAADLAQAGDTVVVHEGEYREWVRPRRGGLSDQRRITYEAAAGEHVVIKGSEQVTGWERVGGTVWKVSVPNSLFGAFNPFAEEIDGDWIVYPSEGLAEEASRRRLPQRAQLLRGPVPAGGVGPAAAHRGARRLDGHARPGPRPRADAATSGTPRSGPTRRRSGRTSRAPTRTRSWSRSTCAARSSTPTEHHLDYITVRGFELAQAACPWTPPTADQPGLIGPNWAKGWIIEDNVIHDAKCSADLASARRPRPGTTTRPRAATSPATSTSSSRCSRPARSAGTSEHIGSHVVRRNTIYDCGQNGIVGHLGCVFSTIEDNHIYNIALKREFYGYEIGGIKLHAAIDVVIRHNRIHDCSLGTWLDWQTQGTRISRNVYYANNRDLFVEVSHGPYLVDHNVFASPASLELFSQGGAFVNNLVCGTLRLEPVMDRATPYHVPHSTQVAGYAVIYGGDDRYIGNVFLGGDIDQAYAPGREVPPARRATARPSYDGHPTSFADYLARIDDQPAGDHERFPGVKQPVYLRDNVYAAGRPRRRRRAGRRSSLDGAGVRRASSRRATRSTCRPSCRRTSTAPASASSPGSTCPRSASSTRTSRSATAPRR